MRMDKTTIKINDVIKDATLEIELTGLRIARVRIFIGCLFFKMGAFIIGAGIKINEPLQSMSEGKLDGCKK